jgi:hypothetical protein
MGGAPIEDEIVKHPAQSAGPNRGGHFDHRARHAADRQTLDARHVAGPKIVDLVNDGAGDAGVATMWDGQRDRERRHVFAAVEPEGVSWVAVASGPVASTAAHTSPIQVRGAPASA